MTFDVGSNELGGPLVTEMGLMSHLEVLRINDNHFSGNIPTELGKLVHLNELHMNGNDFTGSLPASLSNLVALGKTKNYYCQLSYQPINISWCIPIIIILFRSFNLS